MQQKCRFEFLLGTYGDLRCTVVNQTDQTVGFPVFLREVEALQNPDVCVFFLAVVWVGGLGGGGVVWAASGGPSIVNPNPLN